MVTSTLLDLVGRDDIIQRGKSNKNRKQQRDNNGDVNNNINKKSSTRDNLELENERLRRQLESLLREYDTASKQLDNDKQRSGLKEKAGRVNQLSTRVEVLTNELRHAIDKEQQQTKQQQQQQSQTSGQRRRQLTPPCGCCESNKKGTSSPIPEPDPLRAMITTPSRSSSSSNSATTGSSSKRSVASKQRSALRSVDDDQDSGIVSSRSGLRTTSSTSLQAPIRNDVMAKTIGSKKKKQLPREEELLLLGEDDDDSFVMEPMRSIVATPQEEKKKSFSPQPRPSLRSIVAMPQEEKKEKSLSPQPRPSVRPIVATPQEEKKESLSPQQSSSRGAVEQAGEDDTEDSFVMEPPRPIDAKPQEEEKKKKSFSPQPSSSRGAVEHVVRQPCEDAQGLSGLYTGTLVDGAPHGQGIFDYGGGCCYEGEWEHGQKSGYGALYSSDRKKKGDDEKHIVYQGMFQDDVRHGQGMLNFLDGRVCLGDFQDDDLYQGLVHFPDGAMYEGEVVEDLDRVQPRGEDDEDEEEETVVSSAASVIFAGEFPDIVFHGTGKMVWNDGSYYDGEWNMGKPHGYGTQVDAYGEIIHKGQWDNGDPLAQEK